MRNRNRSQQPSAARRDFLFKSACAALTATGITSTIRDLRLINAAAAASLPKSHVKPRSGAGGGAAAPTSASPYKALVCIFMFGGNDANNMLVPTDTATYNQYTAARTAGSNTIALSPTNLASISPLTSDGHTYALNGAMPEVATLFNSGQAAVVANVGTLLAPINRTQYLNHSVAVPPQLFSHNDQQLEWQTSIEDKAPTTGWGGRSADLLYTLNTNNNVSMNISLAGTNTFETGSTINTYNVSTGGAISLNVSNANQLATLKSIIGLNHTNLYENAFATEMNVAINDATLLNTAIAPTASSSYWTTPFPTSSLGNQLKMIARLIQAAPTLGHNRQVFFASIGGFDLHGSEGGGVGAHANILRDLSKCMNALYQASVQLGVSTGVTQFTSSDFSRTFPMNTGLGTDHGWGSHHLILGGSVIGQNIYGTFPTLVVGGPDDTSTGRWIPTTSVDQYAATLAKWFGVSAANMPSVFPYLGRFATPDLGFMGP